MLIGQWMPLKSLEILVLVDLLSCDARNILLGSFAKTMQAEWDVRCGILWFLLPKLRDRFQFTNNNRIIGEADQNSNTPIGILALVSIGLKAVASGRLPPSTYRINLKARSSPLEVSRRLGSYGPIRITPASS